MKLRTSGGRLKPLFAAVADEFLAFVGDARLVAHNAGLDIAFLNAELKRSVKPPIAPERVIDTLVLARRKHTAPCSTPSCWPQSTSS
jgi:DNA polymerase III epsilon subunit-like protein